jgi:hypothetical protein
MSGYNLGFYAKIIKFNQPKTNLMAIIHSGTYLGNLSGKAGPFVVSSWKGVPYLKSRPKKRGPKRGVRERANQSNFSILHYWLKPLIPFLREGFKGYSERVDGFNAAKSHALKNAFTGEKENRVFDPSLVQLSFGDLPLPGDIAVSKTGAFELTFTWDCTHRPDGSFRFDQAMLLAYNDVKGERYMKLTGQFRNSGTGDLQIPIDKSGSYHVYIAFQAHDKSRQSSSVYLGKIDIG